jgi:hypothetical protein
LKTTVVGDAELDDAKANLKATLEAYNAAVGNMTLRMVVKVHEILHSHVSTLIRLIMKITPS